MNGRIQDGGLSAESLRISLTMATGGLLNDDEIGWIVEAIGEGEIALKDPRLQDAIARAAAEAAKRLCSVFDSAEARPRKLARRRTPQARRVPRCTKTQRAA